MARRVKIPRAKVPRGAKRVPLPPGFRGWDLEPKDWTRRVEKWVDPAPWVHASHRDTVAALLRVIYIAAPGARLFVGDILRYCGDHAVRGEDVLAGMAQSLKLVLDRPRVVATEVDDA